MNLKAIVSLLFWFLFGVGTSLGSLKLGLGSASHPRPGFMSFYAGILLILLTIFQAILEIRKPTKEDEKSLGFSMAKYKDLLIILCCLFGYMLVLEKLGYLISICLFIFITFKMKTPKRWITPLLWAIGISICSYFVFAYLLECRLPRGIL